MTMNVVLVVFDTLRKDAVGSYGRTPPWEMGPIATPNLDALARESVQLKNAFPESLPTLCARRAIYTGQRTYPFNGGDFRKLKGDFVGIAPGWGPIPNEQHTLSEILQGAGYRTALISDLYHQFKPSKNFWRGFDQWTFIRGQETDTARSGPGPTQEELDQFVPRRFQEARKASRGVARLPGNLDAFSTACLLNMRDRVREELWFNAQVFQEAARWLEQNRDAEQFFLTVESFDPHEPWFVPEHYRRAYDASEGQEQVVSPYAEIPDLEPELVQRTRANYAGLVTMCDRWFGHLMETLRVLGMLDNTLLIVTSDHGHTLWERRGYIGKRGYPSDPEVAEIPTFVRHPQGVGAGTVSDAWIQHHDIAPTILDALGVAPPEPVDGRSFWGTLLDGAPAARDHVVIGWGTAMTVVTERWWFNAKVDGTGPLLFDRNRRDSFERSVADDEREVCRELFGLGRAEARGGFPEYLLELAQSAADAPGCSPFAAI